MKATNLDLIGMITLNRIFHKQGAYTMFIIQVMSCYTNKDTDLRLSLIRRHNTTSLLPSRRSFLLVAPSSTPLLPPRPFFLLVPLSFRSSIDSIP